MKDVVAVSLLPHADASWASGASGEVERAPHVVLSFEEVYDRHVAFVWHSLCGFGVPRAALDDAVQDVFVVVHRNLAGFEGRSKLTTWLFAIARRVAKIHRHRKVSGGLTREITAVEDQLQDQGPTPFDVVARAEAVELLERLLERLDEKQRLCFVLMEFEQMSAEEIASLLEINVNTVYSRRRLAQLELDRLVEMHGRREKRA